MAAIVCPKCKNDVIRQNIDSSEFDCISCGHVWNEKSKFTFNEAKKIAEQMGVIDACSLIRTLQVLNIISLKAEPKEAGLPIGFHFPWSERDNWTKMCTALQQQGFKIIKDDA